MSEEKSELSHHRLNRQSLTRTYQVPRRSRADQKWAKVVKRGRFGGVFATAPLSKNRGFQLVFHA